jgi:hypothetical protein
MKYMKLLMVLAVLGAYPAVALAHEKPNRTQQAALVKAFDHYVKAPVGARCLREEVSTVNSSWAWVEFGFGHNGQLPAGCARFASNGQVVFHFRAGRWRWVAAGSDFRNANGSCSLSTKMPRRVITDLGLC